MRCTGRWRTSSSSSWTASTTSSTTCPAIGSTSRTCAALSRTTAPRRWRWRRGRSIASRPSRSPTTPTCPAGPTSSSCGPTAARRACTSRASSRSRASATRRRSTTSCPEPLTRKAHPRVDSRPSEDQAAFAERGRSVEGLALWLPSLSDPARIARPPASAATARVVREDALVPAADTTRLAVLIDSDNTTASLTTELLEEIAKYGTPTIKRAYGDWTTPQLAGWKEQLLRHAIQPVQQFAYSRGKNSTDSALIIDAMDLLYAENVEGFVIVSSDSDFTRLATRLRESGMTVYGLGRRTTPEPFVAACDRFIYLDLLGDAPPDPTPVTSKPPRPDLEGILKAAIRSTSRDGDWSNLGEVGSYLSRSHA